MSENKVVLVERKTKTITLPKCKAVVEIYASIIAVDLDGVNVAKLQDKEANNIGQSLKMLSRLIKSWNVYESEDAKEPREINEKAIGQLEIEDLTFILSELGEFITSEKKD